MLASHSHSHAQLHADGVAAGSAGASSRAARFQVPLEAAPYVGRLRIALTLYRRRHLPTELDSAFAAARGLVWTATGGDAAGRPDAEQLRRLAAAVPEFDEFLSVAAATAEQASRSSLAELWRGLHLRSAPPAWTPAEREAARTAFACACAPGQTGPERLRTGLRALAARRFAELLCDELSRDEEAWVAALGDRYGSVRHRCAPRTARRSRGLAELIAGDEETRSAVTVSLARWLASGGPAAGLAAELEAAVVHVRTPARLA